MSESWSGLKLATRGAPVDADDVPTVKTRFGYDKEKAQRFGRRLAAFATGEYLKSYVLDIHGFNNELTSLITGTALNLLIKGVKMGIQAVRRNVTIRVEISSKDPAYEWITYWLTEHPYSKTVTDVSVLSKVERNNTGGDAPARPKLSFIPAAGRHLLTHRGKWVWLSRKVHKKQGVTSGNSKDPQETITLTMLGRSRCSITALITDAMNMYVDRDRSCTVVFVGDQYGGWRRSRSRPKRSLESVILQGTLGEDVLADAKSFLASEDWYLDRGIPYRRGYLFYGPPGSGKTSFITALAGALDLNIYVVSLSNPALTDEALNDLFTDTPQQCVILLEDVDSCFVQDDKDISVTKSQVTFSGILNVLDGVSAPEGRILVMTTNHPSLLAPSLIRPGRVDVRAHFPWASAQQMQEMFRHFFVTHTDAEKLAAKFVSGVQERFPTRVSTLEYGDVDFTGYEDPGHGQVSMASLQGHLMKYREDPYQAVANRFEILAGKQRVKNGNDNVTGKTPQVQ
eukprot:TRINITY_DN5798_c0_g1_i2.p1 TRINITY_DN5798_c0_g1~~TRINITY_DN5798_c0_g1_i2.p1  ORF type:complete len:512 (-),score=87.73 TRINITY_DN5798_c0_g1_i2:220-1755(-)